MANILMHGKHIIDSRHSFIFDSTPIESDTIKSVCAEEEYGCGTIYITLMDGSVHQYNYGLSGSEFENDLAHLKSFSNQYVQQQLL